MIVAVLLLLPFFVKFIVGFPFAKIMLLLFLRKPLMMTFAQRIERVSEEDDMKLHTDKMAENRTERQTDRQTSTLVTQ